MTEKSKLVLSLGAALASLAGMSVQGADVNRLANIGSDLLLMKFKRRLVLVSQRNQYDAASPTSVGLGPSRV